MCDYKCMCVCALGISRCNMSTMWIFWAVYFHPAFPAPQLDLESQMMGSGFFTFTATTVLITMCYSHYWGSQGCTLTDTQTTLIQLMDQPVFASWAYISPVSGREPSQQVHYSEIEIAMRGGKKEREREAGIWLQAYCGSSRAAWRDRGLRWRTETHIYTCRQASPEKSTEGKAGIEADTPQHTNWRQTHLLLSIHLPGEGKWSLVFIKLVDFLHFWSFLLFISVSCRFPCSLIIRSCLKGVYQRDGCSKKKSVNRRKDGS